ncbi:hypothetical protein KEM56_007441 [Ascosphaera pollenicola]|nr:hypothetical protein KEM56_007441 [Ascosphaera pollenicola]
MSELSFCKAFLGAVEARPVKIPADHTFDPFEFQISFPYILPRLHEQYHTPMPKKRKVAPPPGATKSVDIRLKSHRNPALEFTLDKTDINNVSVSDMKAEVQSRIENKGVPVPLDKIKILWKRKPVSGKMVSDVLGDEATTLIQEGGSVEFGVMVLGGASVAEKPAPRPAKKESTPPHVVAADAGDLGKAAPDQDTEMKDVQEASSNSTELDDKFWLELDGFLQTRLSPEQATKARSVFKSAWLANQ